MIIRGWTITTMNGMIETINPLTPKFIGHPRKIFHSQEGHPYYKRTFLFFITVDRTDLLDTLDNSLQTNVARCCLCFHVSFKIICCHNRGTIIWFQWSLNFFVTIFAIPFIILGGNTAIEGVIFRRLPCKKIRSLKTWQFFFNKTLDQNQS